MNFLVRFGSKPLFYWVVPSTCSESSFVLFASFFGGTCLAFELCSGVAVRCAALHFQWRCRTFIPATTMLAVLQDQAANNAETGPGPLLQWHTILVWSGAAPLSHVALQRATKEKPCNGQTLGCLCLSLSLQICLSACLSRGLCQLLTRFPLARCICC